MKKLLSSLVLGVVSTAAMSQNASETSDQLEEIVVTGTSIRGVAPTGSQLTTVDTAAIQAAGATNVADLLATVPALNSFNIAPQGGQSEFNSGGSSTPGLHALPGTATLVLIDGHRAVGDTPLLNVPDPSSIPPSAIDHIEIVADGGSAIYGSDAVAGVINIILKKNFDGAETTASYGDAAHYNMTSLGQSFGKTWSGGSALVAATYAGNTDLRNRDRSFYQAAPPGLAFSPVTNCNPPNVQINGVNYTGPGLLAGPASTCDPNRDADMYNQDRRYALIGNIRQDVGTGVHLWVDAKYTDDRSTELIPQVSNQNIVIPNTNPFFTLPAGVTATSETVQWNTGNLNTPLTDLFTSRSGMVDFGGSIDIGHDWELVTDLDYSWSSSAALNEDNGGVNITALAAAINGTTTQTALDPFGSRTNPKVAAAILNYPLWFYGSQKLWDFNAKVDGKVLALPGGDMKLAIGVANRHEKYSGSDPIGLVGDPDYSNNTVDVGRTVNAAFAEIAVPVFGAANAVRGAQSLNLSVAGRFDKYSDFGNTTNPKFGIDWMPVAGVKFRTSYGTSFHAPQLADTFGIDTRAGGTWIGTPPPGFIIPAGAAFVNAYIAGGRPGLQPEKAKNASIGLDLTPESVPGFKASFTYWMVRFSNEVQIPISFNLNLPSLRSRFVNLNIVDPATGLLGALTPAQYASILNGIRLTGALTSIPPPTVWEITDARRANIGATAIDGWDFDFGYRFQLSDGTLTANVSGEYLTQYESNAGPGTPYFDNLKNGASTQSSDSSAYNVIPWHLRGLVAWSSGPILSQATVNYTGHYNFGYATPCGVTNCNAIQWVKPFVTIDLAASYDLPEFNSFFKNTRLQVNVDNLLNQKPPLVEIAGGFTTLSANPLGRLFSVSVDKRW